MGGVIVVDLKRVTDTEYIRSVANRLKDVSVLCVLMPEDNVARMPSTIVARDLYVDVVHIYMNGNILTEHYHQFYYDGTYNIRVNKYEIKDILSRLETIENKLNEITTNEYS